MALRLRFCAKFVEHGVGKLTLLLGIPPSVTLRDWNDNTPLGIKHSIKPERSRQ